MSAAISTTNQIDSEGALAYEAPFLIEKLLKQHIVDRPEDARSLFTEVKRFLVAAHSIPADGAECNMYSLLVDQVWHEFVLFTREYSDFGERYFGRFIPHNPGNAPKHDTEEYETMTIKEFARHYEALFGVTLPDVWYDDRNVKLERRAWKTRSLSAVRGEDGSVDLLGERGDILLSVGEMALPALEFVVKTPVFFVRELPGDLTDDEKVGLVATLVEYNLLRVAA